MGIPGEDLPGSHPATEFVAWYNGHPDYRDLPVRSLAGAGGGGRRGQRRDRRRPDPVPHARRSWRRPTSPTTRWRRCARAASREVYLLGRRGAGAGGLHESRRSRSSASWPTPTSCVQPEEVELDELSREALEQERRPRRPQEGRDPPGLCPAAGRDKTAAPRPPLPRLARRPCSTTAARSAASGSCAIGSCASATGTIQAKATDQFEELPVGLVFRSVGYRGVPLPGVPFDEKWGVVLNEKGRVLDPDTAAVRRGRVHRGLDQARRHRRDRDQQARRRRDGDRR